MDIQTMKKASIWRRASAFYIDFNVIMFVVLLPLFMNFNIYVENPWKLFSYFNVMMAMSVIGLCLKDIIKGNSLGKWIFSIQVRNIDNPTGKPSIMNLIIRNLLIIVWPVEAIAIAISKDHRRVGDNLAKTDVYALSNKLNALRITISLILLFALFIVSILFTALSAINNDDSYKTAIAAIEKNNEIQAVTGGIVGYGLIPTASISFNNGAGTAEYTIYVKGKTKDLEVDLYMEKEPNSAWKVEEIEY